MILKNLSDKFLYDTAISRHREGVISIILKKNYGKAAKGKWVSFW
jgi:hypothetical protein